MVYFYDRMKKGDIMYQIGSIIIVKNQIFDMGKDNSKTQIDHSKRRPALVIAEDDDSFYYITLTSKSGKGCVQYYTEGEKKQFVQIRHIYSKEIYGAIEVSRVSDSDLFDILIKLCKFHENKHYNNFDKIEKDLLKTIKDLAIKLNKTYFEHKKQI